MRTPGVRSTRRAERYGAAQKLTSSLAATPGPLPVIMWFHGGGQVLGFAAQDAPWLKQLAAALGCAVAAVDYRLAPETPAPGAAEDGYTAYRWISDNATDLGLDPTRVGLAGQSGGGGIAATTALVIRDRGAATPLFQMLMYPMLDDRNTTDSSREFTDIGIWDRSTNLLAWQAVLGDRAGTEDVTPYCAASRATELDGLPPTFIGVGELDVFRDESLDYAALPRAHGVPVELHLYPGAYHAFDLFAPQSHLAESFRHTWNNYLARHLTKAPATATASFLVIGLAVLGYGVHEAVLLYRLRRHGIRARGLVARYESSSGTRGSGRSTSLAFGCLFASLALWELVRR
ncbi:alpha/beta hydrolase [Streptomyces sp. NPDC058579]|uniref:alpha/beta hydrolase n=1 Tax=Streptomyces sp. NPDC058579 TaxID=3346548 RepID=UPI003647761A